MGQTITIVYFTCKRRMPDVEAARHVLTIFKPQVVDAHLTDGSDQSWDECMEKVPYKNRKRLGRLSDVAQWPLMCDTNAMLCGNFMVSEFIAQLYIDMEATIPLTIRGEANPANFLDVCIGDHDLIDLSEDLYPDNPHFVGRVPFSVSFWGYGTPSNWREYRKRIWTVPTLVKIERLLTDAFGPMEKYLSFST
jgi:hypothetical protein